MSALGGSQAFEIIEGEGVVGLTMTRFTGAAVLWLLAFAILFPSVSSEWKREVCRPEDHVVLLASQPSLEVLRDRYEYLLDKLFARHEIIEQSSPMVWNWKNKASNPFWYPDENAGHVWMAGRSDFDHARARRNLSGVFRREGWSWRLKHALFPAPGLGGDPYQLLSLETTADEGARLEYICVFGCWGGRCYGLHDRTLGILRAILETNQEAIRVYGDLPWPVQ